MSRRLIAILSAVCLAALSVTAVAIASSGGGDPAKDKGAAKGADGTAPRTGHGPRRAGGHGPAGFFGGAMAGVVIDSLAGRLGVAPADLRKALGEIRQEQVDKRKAAGTPQAKPDLTALKSELAGALATKLGKTPDEILTAVRAELDARLTQAVTAGWVTQKGHDLALACFDTPATCDMKALRAEVKFFGHGRGHGKKRHGHGDRKPGAKHRHHRPGRAPSTATPGSTTTPGTTAVPGSTTTPGSGQMTPGARSTPTPLRG